MLIKTKEFNKQDKQMHNKLQNAIRFIHFLHHPIH